MAARLKEAKGIGTPAARDTLIEGLKRQGFLETEKEKLKASKLAMAIYALLRQEVPEVLDPAATADMERRLDDLPDYLFCFVRTLGRLMVSTTAVFLRRFACEIDIKRPFPALRPIMNVCAIFYGLLSS